MKVSIAKLHEQKTAIELVDMIINEQSQQLKELPDSKKKILISSELFDKYILELSELSGIKHDYSDDWSIRHKGILIQKA